MESRFGNYPSTTNVELDFEEVEVGVTKIKSLKIVNQSNKKQEYVVQRDSKSNILDSVFNTVDYTWTLEPCECRLCDISYKPILSNRKYIDYFFITDAHRCSYRLTVQGYSIGPNVTCSTKESIMVCKSGNCAVEKSVKLTNKANVPAKFMFDVDITQCPFKVDKISGIIEPSSSQTFIMSFVPSRTGIYKYNMYCLISNQDPIILKMYGLCCCNLNSQSIQNFHSRVQASTDSDATNNFITYMKDVTNRVTNDLPEVSLSQNSIDFEFAETGEENFAKRTPQTVCLTNHKKYDVFILWECDDSKIFCVHPQESKIRSNQSAIFEIRFDPTEVKKFYSKELGVRIFQIPLCASKLQTTDVLIMNSIPTCLSVRLIGHTYDHCSNDWMPQYEIPETVTMPACVPGLPVYTSFVMRNFSHQQLMFRFIPPSTSHYNVKPMAGLITPEQEYQIIAVQLFPEATDDEAYVERWAVRLNGNPKNEIYVNFQGYCEHAKLVFGCENSVNFHPVQIGCQQKTSVMVRNITRHLVKFEYSSNLPRELHIQPTHGSIQPNETSFHDWIFQPDEVKSYEFIVPCTLSTVMSDRRDTFEIDASGNGMEGSLIACPEVLNFGDRAYNSTTDMEFKIFNFSAVVLHFLLICRSAKILDIMKNPEKDITLIPSCGTILPGRGQTIQAIFTPLQAGFYEMILGYFIKSDSSSDGRLLFSQPKNLITITCMCYLPTLQVKDLLYQAETNRGLSKLFLWETLCIDDLNTSLRNLLPSEESLAEMIIPLSALQKYEKLMIKLLLKNSNPITATWLMKKRKTCMCNDLNKKNNFPPGKNWKSVSKKKCLRCIQDESFLIYPEKVSLKANESDILTIEIKSNTLSTTGIFWDLDIGEKRHITLNLKLESCILQSGHHLKFDKIYIGDCKDTQYKADTEIVCGLYHVWSNNWEIHSITVSAYKAIWLYNSLEDEIQYTIDTRSLARINKNNYGIIFACLNPVGKIRQLDRKPVFFGFHPSKVGKYQVTLPIRVGDVESLLEIEAESTVNITQNSPVKENCPFFDTFKTQEIIAYFNSNCILIPSMPTHGKITKMVMVHNYHQFNVLHYEWQNYEIPGFIKINVIPTNGLIQPQSLVTFFIEVITCSKTCSLNIEIFVKFLDVSKRRSAEKKKMKRDNILNEMKDQFTITEKGIFYPNIKFEDTERPLTFCKGFTLKINVFSDQYDSQTEKDSRRTATVEMKKFVLPCANLDILRISSLVIENTIWDLFHNIHFTNELKNVLIENHDLKYSQLSTNITRKQQSQIEKSDCLSSKRLIDDILHRVLCRSEMISMIVHEEFNLATNHFPHPLDARQISCQKIYTETLTQ